jgi:hypothetical protein
MDQSIQFEERRSKLVRDISESTCSAVNLIGSESWRLETIVEREEERSSAREIHESAERLFEACVALYSSGYTDFIDEPEFARVPDWVMNVRRQRSRDGLE